MSQSTESSQSSDSSAQFLQTIIEERTPNDVGRLPEFHRRCKLEHEAGLDFFYGHEASFNEELISGDYFILALLNKYILNAVFISFTCFRI